MLSTQVKHFPILSVYLNLSDQSLCVSTQGLLPQDVLAAATSSDEVLRNTGGGRSETAFECEQLFLAQSWNHVAVVMQKPALKGKAKVTLFINGQSVGTQRVCLCVHMFVCNMCVCVHMFTYVCVCLCVCL